MGEKKRDSETGANSSIEDTQNSSKSTATEGTLKSDKKNLRNNKKITENENITNVDNGLVGNNREDASPTLVKEKKQQEKRNKTNEQTAQANQTKKDTREEDAAEIRKESESEENPEKPTEEASTNNEYKLRIVPLEKLLAKPPSQLTNNNEKRSNNQKSTTGNKRALRERNNTSIIELSDSEEEEEEEEQAQQQEAKRTRFSGGNVHRKNSSEQNKSTVRARADLTKNQGKQNRSRSCSIEAAESSSKKSSNISGSVTALKDKSVIRKGLKNCKKEEQLSTAVRRSTSQSTVSSVSSRSEANKEAKEEKEKSQSPKTRSRQSRRARIVSSSSDKEEVVTARNLKDKTNTISSKSKKKPESTVTSTFKQRRCLVRVQRLKLVEKASNKITTKLHSPSPTNEENVKKTMSETEPTSSRRRRNLESAKEDDENSDYETQADERTEDDAAELSSATTEDGDGANSSDSEVLPQRKKRVFKSKKKNGDKDDDSDFELGGSKKKRRRIKKNSSDSDGSDGDDDDDKNKIKRKHIRKIIKTKDLDISTKNATKEEEDRRKRIVERQKIYNQIFDKSENVEITELVLDFDDESKRALLEVDKKLLKKLKPHQVAGVKFMWDACFETLKDADEKPGSGCILAHCMGLGKTLQIVTLSHTLLANSRRTNMERVLIISPLSTLNNWAREFQHWMSFAQKKDIEIYDISRYKDKPTRIFKLYEWFQEGGVCILGYDMYRILANEKAKGLRKKQREQLQEALVDPGADLVVCDEGHLLKNEKTSISKAVTKMRTKRRIVLTGTPLQNNLKEYYCMIQFVKPNLLGTYKEYMNRFVNPISNGQYTDSTERDLRLMKHRSHILHKLLEGCIQRRDYSVLAPYLPPKHEYVVYTTLSELQQELYEYYMSTQRDLSSSDIGGKGARLFQDFQDLRRIWTHPMNLRVNSDNVIAKRLLNNDDSDMEGFICDESETEATNSTSDSEDTFKSDASAGGVGGGAHKTKKHRTRNATGNGDDESESFEELSAAGSSQKDDPSEWWKRFVQDKELNNINHSPKLLILMQLLQQCEAIGDKLLVFSQSLQSLDVIEHFLALIDSNTHNYEYEGDVGNFKGVWKPGVDYFRLDGSCSVEQREAMCKKFNNSTNLRARLFLISTRAGGLGINLVAANRVVIFDVSWNPSHDTQSIFRVYRFGQVKPCYIYRLIAMGTMEQKVYERQVAKQATAKRVIDEQQISRHYNQTDLMELYTYDLVPNGEREVPILPKDRLFAELLSDHEKLIFKYHEHDSLLEQEESENLSEMERKAAWDEYEAEKTRTVQTAQYISYDRGAFGATVASQFGNASGSVTSNKIFGFRSDILLQLLNMKIAKDYPDMSQNQIIQLVPTYLQTLYTQMNNGDPTLYKDLLNLHSTIVHPSGMYMNPLLYANQNPTAAGYFQAGAAPGQPQGTQQPPPAGAPVAPGPMDANSVQGFQSDTVYEID